MGLALASSQSLGVANDGHGRSTERHPSISNAIGRRRIYNLRELRGDLYADTRSYALICPRGNADFYEIFIPRPLRLFAIHTSNLLFCNVFSWSRRFRYFRTHIAFPRNPELATRAIPGGGDLQPWSVTPRPMALDGH